MGRLGANLFGLGGPMQDAPPRRRRYPSATFYFTTGGHPPVFWYNKEDNVQPTDKPQGRYYCKGDEHGF